MTVKKKSLGRHLKTQWEIFKKTEQNPLDNNDTNAFILFSKLWHQWDWRQLKKVCGISENVSCNICILGRQELLATSIFLKE